MTHTPGPWKASASGAVFATTPDNDIIGVADCRTVDTDRFEREANARLIAAAPELLEACQLALNDYAIVNERITTLEGIERLHPFTIGPEQLKAAIAKATGES
jgi:hypothetical protein